MSKGKDDRVEREGKSRDVPRSERTVAPRSSRTSVAMTPERARAIQAAADRAGVNQDFKARAMAAAAPRAPDAPPQDDDDDDEEPG